MAFSLRKMLSNISYFTKPGDEENAKIRAHDDTNNENCLQNSKNSIPASENIEFDRAEADSTSKSLISPNLPSPRHFCAAKKSSLSDTDLLKIAPERQERKKCRKLKLDVEKAQSMNNSFNDSEDSANLENTPKHKLLECKSADYFKDLNFNQSFDISDAESDVSSFEEDIVIESVLELSDTDISDGIHDKTDIKMCRKVENHSQPELSKSVTPESFADVEIDKNEAERIALLQNYETKLEKMECFLKNLLTEFQFHIEVSKVFNCKSIVTALPEIDVPNIPKSCGDVKYIDNIHRGISPAGWNFVLEKEDETTKAKLKNQLERMRHSIDEFLNTYLKQSESKPKARLQRRDTYILHKSEVQHKPTHLSYKKKIKYFDFPDLREAMIKLFSPDDIDNVDENDSLHCSCNCHSQESESTLNSDKNTPDHSITSSIGNFTLDSTTLSAYSESLDQIVSYNSFNDTYNSLYNTLLQTSAIERISFYVQVHSIQLKCEIVTDYESKNIITFYCPTCKTTDYEENGLLKHILSSNHCEKIHFVYKTAYVQKCISAGKEIQPSTVLNSMTMYRDDNKIVCFGDAFYACSLCFENLLIGESVLMAHCSDIEHVHRREMLTEIFD